MSVVLEQQDLQLNRSYDAYFLVVHGSQDLHSWLVLQELIECANAIGDVVVGGGCLEGQPSSLSQQIQDFCAEICEEIYEQGDTEDINVAVVPLFLLSGVHVMADLPSEVAIARQKLIGSFAHLDRQITLEIVPHLGTHPDIPALLKSIFEMETSSLKEQFEHTNIGLILLSHGSRRPEAVQSIENLASQLGAIAAHWTGTPTLDAQIEQSIAQGRDSIVVMPYFLFAGEIMNAIAKQISLYADRIPIYIAPIPFSPAQIADMAIDLVN
ncbi:sirohydrochlorin chelatase [Pseudanabaena sp. PCC 6802]|uniref:sirohydrochlorin chelatase n=1 Tax=Pseudanabaena sp. PCC 6802 TaxID=118173 RepID=UPI000346FEAB|nr:CbiX/SirB N-terminal domain-containing protein [Pseudanabaena sp. PCC 6802]